MTVTSISQLSTPYSSDPNVNGIIWPGWPTYNYELPTKNYVNFSFNSSAYKGKSGYSPTSMTDVQKQSVRNALSYVHEITGINFNEVGSGTAEDVDLYFGYANLPQGVLGLDQSGYVYESDQSGALTSVDRYDSITISKNYDYLSNLTPGAEGYETLLHEIGHAMGLTDVTVDKSLPAELDNKDATLMSYNRTQANINRSVYGPLDLKALAWIYGGDGLLGSYGLTLENGFPVAKGSGAASAMIASA